MKNYLFHNCLIACLLIATHNFYGMPEGKTSSAKPAKPSKSSDVVKKMSKEIIAEKNTQTNAQRQAAGLPPLPEFYQGKNPTAKMAEASEQADSLDFSGKPKVIKSEGLDMSSSAQSEAPAPRKAPAKPPRNAKPKLEANLKDKAAVEVNYQARTHNAKVKAQNTALSNQADAVAGLAPNKSLSLGSGKSFLTGLRSLDFSSFFTSKPKTGEAKTSEENVVKTETSREIAIRLDAQAKKSEAIAQAKRAQAEETKAKLAQATAEQAQQTKIYEENKRVLIDKKAQEI